MALHITEPGAVPASLDRAWERGRGVGLAGVIAVLALFALPSAAGGELAPPIPIYRLRAAISANRIEGTIAVSFTNASNRVLDEAVFVRFANRFAEPDAGINDFNRQFVYPELEFDAGRMEIRDVRLGDAVLPTETLREPGVPDGALVRVVMPPLPPGEVARLTLNFRTEVPHRFGSFGEFEQQLTLNGGWYPYLAAANADGTWNLAGPPPLAHFEVQLSNDIERDVVLNGRSFVRGQSVQASVDAHYLSLVAAPQLLRDETRVDGTRIVFLHQPERRARRDTFEPTITAIMMSTLRDIVAKRPAQLTPPDEITVVEVPLRLNLTANGEGMALVSDRALKVNWLLRPFHQLQLAQALYTELLRDHLAAVEPPGDYWWVSEGLAHELARRYAAQAHPDTRSVQQWIELFNIFAIVDRFETVPKIPFVETFFERARVVDPMHAEIATFNTTRPPGHVIFGKLRESMGQTEFDAAIDRCATAPTPFRHCVAREGDVNDVTDQWLQPYPALNYRFEAVDLNQRESDHLRHTLTIRRDASRSITEPVTVRLRSVGGRDVDLRWDGRGERVQLSAETLERMWQATIDPDRKLLEDRRDDNACPPTPQVVLDTAEVEVSSTEFGISGLVVARGRYDYRKDLALAASYTNRSTALTFGGRWHWGEPIDATLYRHNVYAFYGFQWLNGGFTDARQPAVRTPGQLASLGMRYDYSNVFSYDNPSDERHVRLYADWFDQGLGSDFNYVDWGVRMVGTHPVWTHRTIAAVELLNGFSEPLGSSRVPNQGLYSLGGSRSIRGIGVEDELARNLLLVRTELRQDIYPEIDFNLLDLLVLRRGQVRLFADSGRVNNSAGRVYDVGAFAVGVGAGFAAVYEFLGFFPSVAYLEVATRVDDSRKTGDVQFLFGTRQAF